MKNSDALFNDVSLLIDYLKGKLSNQETKFIQKAVEENPALKDFVEGIRLDLEKNPDKKPLNEFLEETYKDVLESIKTTKSKNQSAQVENQNLLQKVTVWFQAEKSIGHLSNHMQNIFSVSGKNGWRGKILFKRGGAIKLVALQLLVFVLFLNIVIKDYNKHWFGITNTNISYSSDVSNPQYSQNKLLNPPPVKAVSINNSFDDCTMDILSGKKIEFLFSDRSLTSITEKKQLPSNKVKEKSPLDSMLDSLTNLTTEILHLDDQKRGENFKKWKLINAKQLCRLKAYQSLEYYIFRDYTTSNYCIAISNNTIKNYCDGIIHKSASIKKLEQKHRKHAQAWMEDKGVPASITLSFIILKGLENTEEITYTSDKTEEIHIPFDGETLTFLRSDELLNRFKSNLTDSLNCSQLKDVQSIKKILAEYSITSTGHKEIDKESGLDYLDNYTEFDIRLLYDYEYWIYLMQKYGYLKPEKSLFMIDLIRTYYLNYDDWVYK